MIRIIKHAINQFNVSTVVEGFDMTIDEMLVYIPQLNRKKQKLQFMKSKMPKARSMNAFMKNIIDYEYVNYDLDAVKADFEAVSEELTKAQLALDKVNNSIEFEIEV